MSVEDWDVDFAFPDFNLALFERERSWCRYWIVTFSWKKIWSVFEIFKADHGWKREWTGRNERGFPKKLTSESFDKLKLTLKSFFAFCSVFFFYKDQRRKDGNDFEKDTVLGFQNTPALHLRAKTYSALSFDQINFFNMTNFLSLSWKPFAVCYCFREPIKTFFFDACQIIVKSRVLHLFPVPQTGRSHKMNILLASFFRSVL